MSSSIVHNRHHNNDEKSFTKFKTTSTPLNDNLTDNQSQQHEGKPFNINLSLYPRPKNNIQYSNAKFLEKKRLHHHVTSFKKQQLKAQQSILDNQIFQPSTEGLIEAEGIEKTYKFSQEDILANTDSGLLKKVFDLHLSYGPYKVESSRNGTHFLMGGRTGQISLVNSNSFTCLTELNVQETVRDIKFLQDHTMFAIAQKKYIYVYDHQGIELHCMRDNLMTYALDYLPYHFLLTSIGEFGELSYDDISTGKVVAKHSTRRGPCQVMRQNNQNANIFLGHTRGTVTNWVPNLSQATVEILTHKGPVTSLDVYKNYLVTSGFDGYWKIWDLRMNKVLYCYSFFGTAPKAINISQTGLIALGFGSHTQFWKDGFQEKQKMPYLTQEYPGTEISSISFRPYEDNCFIGRSDGVSSILVPGSGIANYDILEENPYETKTQRKEKLVKKLLEKLPSDMISVANTFATYDPHNSPTQSKDEFNNSETNQNNLKSKKKKKKMRGRGSGEAQNRASNKMREMKLRKIKTERLSSNKNKKIIVQNAKNNGTVLDRFKKINKE